MWPDMTPLIWFAGFGMIVAVILGIAALVGFPIGLWWLAHHIAFV